MHLQRCTLEKEGMTLETCQQMMHPSALKRKCAGRGHTLELGGRVWNTSAEDALRSSQRCWKDGYMGVVKWIPCCWCKRFVHFIGHLYLFIFLIKWSTQFSMPVFSGRVISRYRNMDGLRYIQALTLDVKVKPCPAPRTSKSLYWSFYKKKKKKWIIKSVSNKFNVNCCNRVPSFIFT